MLFMILSIVIISLIGTLFHFMYDITKHNKVIGLFAAVNESTWEHIKIALTPTILWSLMDGAVFGTDENYFLAKFVSLAVIIVLMPVLFYGHRYISKKESVLFNILSFYIVIIASQLAFYSILNIEPVGYVYRYIGCIGTFIIFGAYMTLTLMPIKNFIFKDPITHKYGFKGHKPAFHIRKKRKEK